MAEPSKELTVSQQINNLAPQFKAALPPHIPVERFVRIVLTAVNSTPALQSADRRSLFEAAMKCAADGLVPDGRDAAFVIYGAKVVYMPMVWGIVKKVRNSGELAEITSHVVHANDDFVYEFGDSEGIGHKPKFSDRGAPIGAYAIAKTKDGAIYREYMTAEEINAVKEISKAKNSGPWAGPFYLEMWRKTVIRRLAKRLPMSTDLEDFMRRDDDMYDLEKTRHRDLSSALESLEAPSPTNKSPEPTPTDEQKTHEPADIESVEEPAKKEIDAEPKEPRQSSESTKVGTPKPQGEITVESLVATVNSVTSQNWEEVFRRVSKGIAQLKSPEDKLEVTKAMNRKKAEL